MQKLLRENLVETEKKERERGTMRLKAWVKDLFLSIGIAIVLFEILDLMSLRFQQLEKKKTDLSITQISPK